MRNRLFSQILALSIPAIFANVSTPLLSMSDMAISGRMGSADVLAATALGGVIFNLIYWLLGFLRMGTSGLTAQAYGGKNVGELSAIIRRSLTLAILIGVLIIVLQYPLFKIILYLMDAKQDVMSLAFRYCSVCIWGAPATLMITSFNGWYVGRQNSRFPMIVAFIQLAVNVVLSIIFVFKFHLGIEGIALGTAITQWVAVGVFLIVSRKFIFEKGDMRISVFDKVKILQFFRINFDIFLRTLCMVLVTFWFTRTGSAQGVTVLAANSLLMQLFTFFSYFMDGYAYSGEAICGRLKGAGDIAMLRLARVDLYKVGGITAVIFAVTYFFAGSDIVGFLSKEQIVNHKAAEYMMWAATIPLAGFAAFIGDGIAVGLVETRKMLMSLVWATVAFFAVIAICYPLMNNHGLWLAFVVYLLCRSYYLWKKL